MCECFVILSIILEESSVWCYILIFGKDCGFFKNFELFDSERKCFFKLIKYFYLCNKKVLKKIWVKYKNNIFEVNLRNILMIDLLCYCFVY